MTEASAQRAKLTETKSSTVRLRGVHRYSFRRMQWGDIIGTKMMTSTDYGERPVFIVQYPDGVVDYIPITSVSDYELGPAEVGTTPPYTRLIKGDFFTVVEWVSHVDNSYKGNCLQVIAIDDNLVRVCNHVSSSYRYEFTLDLNRVTIRKLSSAAVCHVS